MNSLKPSIWSPGVRYGHPLAKGLISLWPFWGGSVRARRCRAKPSDGIQRGDESGDRPGRRRSSGRRQFAISPVYRRGHSWRIALHRFMLVQDGFCFAATGVIRFAGQRKREWSLAISEQREQAEYADLRWFQRRGDFVSIVAGERVATRCWHGRRDELA